MITHFLWGFSDTLFADLNGKYILEETLLFSIISTAWLCLINGDVLGDFKFLSAVTHNQPSKIAFFLKGLHDCFTWNKCVACNVFAGCIFCNHYQPQRLDLDAGWGCKKVGTWQNQFWWGGGYIQCLGDAIVDSNSSMHSAWLMLVVQVWCSAPRENKVALQNQVCGMMFNAVPDWMAPHLALWPSWTFCELRYSLRTLLVQ